MEKKEILELITKNTREHLEEFKQCTLKLEDLKKSDKKSLDTVTQLGILNGKAAAHKFAALVLEDLLKEINNG